MHTDKLSTVGPLMTFSFHEYLQFIAGVKNIKKGDVCDV
jgi:hypothetical protein